MKSFLRLSSFVLAFGLVSFNSTNLFAGLSSYDHLVAIAPGSPSDTYSGNGIAPRYGAIDLGTNAQPIKVTPGGNVLFRIPTGTTNLAFTTPQYTYKCFASGSSPVLSPKTPGDTFEAYDVADIPSGANIIVTVVGQETSWAGTSIDPVQTGIQTWTLSSGSMAAGTPNNTGATVNQYYTIYPDSGVETLMDDGISLDQLEYPLLSTYLSNTMASGNFIDKNGNIWSTQWVGNYFPPGSPPNDYFDDYKNSTELGNGVGYIAYLALHPGGTGYSLNLTQALAVSASGHALLKNYHYTGSGILSSTDYAYSTAGDGSDNAALGFIPTGLNDDGVVVGTGTGSQGVWWESTGGLHDSTHHGFASGFAPTGINAKTITQGGSILYAYQAVGSGSLSEMNPTSTVSTATFNTPVSIDELLPSDSGWNNFGAGMYNGYDGYAYNSNSINDNGLIIGMATKTSDSTSHGLLLIPTELAVDVDRNGTIVMANENPSGEDVNGNPVDLTTQDKPYRFWVNNNEDQPSSSFLFGTSPFTVPPVPANEDYTKNVIISQRDLEDWTRLWIYTKGLNQAIHDGTIKVGLKWSQVISGAPGIKLVTATDTDGGTEYLQQSSNATTQATTGGSTPRPLIQDATPGVSSNYLVTATTSSSPSRASDFVFPTSTWTNLTDAAPKTFFLFEGASKGKGQLEIVFLKSDGTTKIGEGGSVWLDLRDVKEMYERAIATPSAPPTEPYEAGYTAFNDSTVTTHIDALDPDGTTGFNKPYDETQQCVVFVHGWYTDYDSFINYSETFYKRLWWQGYKGHFVGYHWPALSGPATYNSSEWIAWVYGRAFLNYMNHGTNSDGTNGPNTKFTTVTVAGHSMGNVVIGSAIQEGLSMNNYILLEAALPTGCYTTASSSDDPYNHYQPFLDAEAIKATPNLAANLGYRNYIAPNKGNVSNYYCFFNPDDFALHGGSYPIIGDTNWEADQKKYKPDKAPGYDGWTQATTTGRFYDMWEGQPVNCDQAPSGADQNIRNVTDIYECMSFVARPRSQAIGADTNSTTIFVHGFNLETTYGFGNLAPDHSGQFTRTSDQVWSLYQEFETIVAPPPSP